MIHLQCFFGFPNFRKSSFEGEDYLSTQASAWTELAGDDSEDPLIGKTRKKFISIALASFSRLPVRGLF